MSISKPIVCVENLVKAYRIGLRENVPDTLLGSVAAMVQAPFRNFKRLTRLDTSRSGQEAEDTILALRNVTFDVAEGEVVGIIGRNGAGKSTLLKVLSRITEPTSGQVVLRGRVSSLLEVGTGFHPELTGRENVYLNGTILGMKKSEIDRKFDEIVDFSGVERFLETPIKRYSSGMKVRLAFSVAAHLEPEILIVDEVLAVGDLEFQSKCLGKMHSVASTGRTVLFVSHNMTAVQSLCDKSILIDEGTLCDMGPTKPIVDQYLARYAESLSYSVEFEACDDKDVQIERLNVTSKAPGIDGSIDVTDDIYIDIQYVVRAPVSGVHISLIISKDSSVILRSWDTDFHHELTRTREPGTYRWRAVIPRGILGLGQYIVGYNIGMEHAETISKNHECVAFQIVSSTGQIHRSALSKAPSMLSLPLEWTQR